MNFSDKTILDYNEPLTYEKMAEYLNEFSSRYDFISLTSIGTSILGKSIYAVTLGNESSDTSVLYVGAHHGMEWITTALLLRYINEYCEYYKNNRLLYSINIQNLFRTRKIIIIPMLNPDGVNIQISGPDSAGPLKQRILSMNNENDFTHWQANARGVDLNHNYNAGFFDYKKVEAELGIISGSPGKYSGEEPESEPETGALSNFIRFNKDIKLIFTLHTQGEEIFCGSENDDLPRLKTLGKLFSRMCGYKLSIPEGTALYGGLSDWAIASEKIPSYTIECGKGVNPLPISDFFSIYSSIRELLFRAPVMI